MTRKQHTRRRKSSKRGGGYSFDPLKAISVGNLQTIQYQGTGKDCVSDTIVRPGFISGHSGNGVPGMRGGKRRSMKKRSMKKRGGYVPAVAPIHGENNFEPLPMAPQPAVQKQAGGRYESNPGALLNNGSDIGMAFRSATHSIGCERGSVNSLNMRGGSQGVPVVHAGAADSMSINMPTAGYGHQFEIYKAPNAVGGLMINTPYDARAFNQACVKTGGSRRRRASKRSKRAKRSMKK